MNCFTSFSQGPTCWPWKIITIWERTPSLPARPASWWKSNKDLAAPQVMMYVREINPHAQCCCCNYHSLNAAILCLEWTSNPFLVSIPGIGMIYSKKAVLWFFSLLVVRWSRLSWIVFIVLSSAVPVRAATGVPGKKISLLKVQTIFSY